ncbi:MAG: hypothetical protein F6K19_36235 [Cyanothece sp. SIO1E1]|nr:hypothetical protein [Cyanothece sp. SIO1E1]
MTALPILVFATLFFFWTREMTAPEKPAKLSQEPTEDVLTEYLVNSMQKPKWTNEMIFLGRKSAISPAPVEDALAKYLAESIKTSKS